MFMSSMHKTLHYIGFTSYSCSGSTSLKGTKKRDARAELLFCLYVVVVLVA